MLEQKASYQLWVILLITLIGAAAFVLRFHFSGQIQDITGRVSSQVYVGYFYGNNCSVNLSSGWNLFSIYCLSYNMSTPSVFGSINTTLISVHGYDSGNLTDKWKAYKPGLPAWVVQDLQLIDVTKGYWVNVREDDEVRLEGDLKYPRYIGLLQGWNLMGYPRNESINVSVVLASIISNLDSVRTYVANDTADPWKIFSTSGASQNDLINMSPGQGYWIKMDSGDIWVVE